MMLGASLRTCPCDFDPDYHREFNQRRGNGDDPRCKNERDPPDRPLHSLSLRVRAMSTLTGADIDTLCRAADTT